MVCQRGGMDHSCHLANEVVPELKSQNHAANQCNAFSRSFMVTVTAAVLVRQGKILIARRVDKYLGGLWEFPGGKLEQGEAPEQCLERELFEEFGIKTQVGKHVITNIHQYDHIKIKLMSYWVKHLDGEFDLRSHDKIAWINPSEFSQYEMAPADIPTVEAIIAGRVQNEL